MNIALWIIQIILATLFLTSGSLKLVLSKDRLSTSFNWIDDFSQQQVKIISSFEVLGALGLFLPGVYGVFEILIPLAALGLAIMMVFAAIVHLKRFEQNEMILNLILFVLLLLVSISRFIM
ncbi:DoxX family protein [Draconibacterium sp. IB214405]|uniref:DoxX family protein n=1 Tax=Draconibacterium sp. IB214405 TaxID=3097352 RepID=UPI002A183F35|nr:DoxX family protein [Draconibacterium sp. IB214405]MDX8341603.1 DoxX family protein [Draconibacterium sp. IB214405]